MANNTLNEQPAKFTPNVLYTVSGAAFAVWLICLVLSTLLPPKCLNSLQWRWIAAAISYLLGFGIYKIPANISKGFTYVKLAITYGILNGCLIFINASGVNAVSTGLFLDKNLDTTAHGNKKSSLLSFSKEICWWPDLKLKQENQRLVIRNQQLIDHIKTIDESDKKASISDTSSKQSEYNKLMQHHLENLKKSNDSLSRLFAIVSAENSKLKKQNLAVKKTDEIPNNTKPTEDEVRIIERQLAQCRNENAELSKKLSRIKNYQQILNSADKFGL